MNRAQSSRLLAWLAPGVIAVAFLIAFFSTLGHYGMTWDEAENFYAGERNFRVFTSGSLESARFPEAAFEQKRFRGDNVADYGRELERFWQSSGSDFRPETHARFVKRTLAFGWPFPPVSNTASAFTDWIFAQTLGVLDPLPAHHAAIGLIWAVLIVAASRFTRRLAGHVAATIAAITLAVSPRLWGPVHNNIKDVPEAAFFALALMALYKGVVDRRPAWVVGAGAISGLAVGTKLNGVFVFVVGALWLAGTIGRRPPLENRMRAALAAAPFVGGAVVLLGWPYLWPDPIGRTIRALRYGVDILAETPDRGPGFAAFYAMITTPVAVLVLALVGAVWLLRKRWRSPHRPALLLGLWLGIPLLRVNLPGTGFYDGIRQFMEYWPALAIICGIGAGATAVWAAGYVQRVLHRQHAAKLVAAGAVAAFAFVPSLASTLALHPYEDAYFNELVGGLSGARSANIDWASDYWGNSYLEGVRWANAHLERGATVIAPIGGHLPRYDGLRPDIKVEYRPPRSAPSGDTYLMYLTRDEQYSAWLERYDRRPPLFEVSRDGVALLKVYRMDPDLPPFRTSPS